MSARSPQSQDSVKSFGWQWTQQSVVDCTRTFYRRLFKDAGSWSDHHDGKVIAYVCSGNGRHVWALSQLTKAQRIISVELSHAAVEHQKRFFAADPRVALYEGDVAEVEFQADFIYLVGAIQHTSDPPCVLQRAIEKFGPPR